MGVGAAHVRQHMLLLLLPMQQGAPPAEPCLRHATHDLYVMLCSCARALCIHLVLQVVVHNLPWSCTWQMLKDHFRDWKVDRADIVEDQYGRSRCVWVHVGCAMCMHNAWQHARSEDWLRACARTGDNCCEPACGMLHQLVCLGLFAACLALLIGSRSDPNSSQLRSLSLERG